MKGKFILLFICSLTIALAVSCGEKDDLLEPQPLDLGAADLSNMVSIGNSLTAGYMSGALLSRDSGYSFGKLIADQANVDYVQPQIAYPGIGTTTTGVYELSSLAGTPAPVPITGSPLALWTNQTAVYNNLGIPGIMTYDVLNAIDATSTFSAVYAGGSPNTFVDIILRGSGNNPLEQALAQNPTFATLWIGNNDVLGAVVNGNVIDGVMPTPKTTFELLFTQIVSAIDAENIDFVVCNIPSVMTIPYARTLPPYIIDANKNVVLVNGSPVPYLGITDPANSLVLLTASGYAALGYGIPTSMGGNGQDMPDAAWLDPTELAAINQAVTDFNEVITRLSTTYNYAVVDVNTLLTQAAAGLIEVGGEVMGTAFVTGGLFSLDGVHPSARGYGLVANKIIAAINNKYEANIRLVDVTSLPALELPVSKSGRRMDWIDIYRETGIGEQMKALFPIPNR